MKTLNYLAVHVDSKKKKITLAGVGETKGEAVQKTIAQIGPGKPIFTFAIKQSGKKTKFDFLHFLADNNIFAVEAKAAVQGLAELLNNLLQKMSKKLKKA